jgi:hypothetical protein
MVLFFYVKNLVQDAQKVQTNLVQDYYLHLVQDVIKWLQGQGKQDQNKNTINYKKGGNAYVHYKNRT